MRQKGAALSLARALHLLPSPFSVLSIKLFTCMSPLGHRSRRRLNDNSLSGSVPSQLGVFSVPGVLAFGVYL